MMNEYVYFVCQNERRHGLYIDLLMTVRYNHEVWDEQTQSRLLEKTHQSNGNLCKNDSVLMPKSRTRVRPEKYQFMEKGQNRNFNYKIFISVKNL